MPRTASLPLLLMSVVATVLILTHFAPVARGAGSSGDAATLAHQILDDHRSEAERKQIILDHPQLSLELLKQLVADMPQNDLKEEYRRIPWIWRVTVAAGKRNQLAEMKPILDFCVPKENAPLRDWQAVVLGGGIINGIGLTGGWADEQCRAMVANNPDLTQRWARMLKLAGAMVDNRKVFKGTRYDALRIVGMDSWNHRGGQLTRYLVKGVDGELQQGAIGGLGDMRAPAVAQALLSGFAHYAPENREFALKALLRERGRTLVLLEALEVGTVKTADLGAVRLSSLINSPDDEIRHRTRAIVSGPAQ